MQSIRILEIPDCRMISSGVGMFGDENFNRFKAFLAAQPRGIFPRDFLFWDKTGFHWLYLPSADTVLPEDFALIDFRGGLYAVATDIDQRTDTAAMRAAVDEFLLKNGFVRDDSRPELGNIITSPAVRDILGYEQMDYYTPIRPVQP